MDHNSVRQRELSSWQTILFSSVFLWFAKRWSDQRQVFESKEISVFSSFSLAFGLSLSCWSKPFFLFLFSFVWALTKDQTLLYEDIRGVSFFYCVARGYLLKHYLWPQTRALFSILCSVLWSECWSKPFFSSVICFFRL